MHRGTCTGAHAQGHMHRGTCLPTPREHGPTTMPSDHSSAQHGLPPSRRPKSERGAPPLAEGAEPPSFVTRREHAGAGAARVERHGRQREERYPTVAQPAARLAHGAWGMGHGAWAWGMGHGHAHGHGHGAWACEWAWACVRVCACACARACLVEGASPMEGAWPCA